MVRLNLALVRSSGENVPYNIGLLCSALMPDGNVKLLMLLVDKTKCISWQTVVIYKRFSLSLSVSLFCVCISISYTLIHILHLKPINCIVWCCSEQDVSELI